MREILFRGKRIDNGEWVYGYYGLFKGRSDIYVPFTEEEEKENEGHIFSAIGGLWHNVIADTLGQFTGLTDKNGKKIFEGDIVRGRHWTSYNDKKPEDFHLWRVDWSEKSGLITFVDSPTTKARMSIHDFADFGEVEVVGNIHDQPELLETT